ncbi:hypothetical protein AB0I81_02505 [Nonomuraea sp. NPDC050404]|uniref:hypothetical protein n=1 Tax=Nonomuraea sp. NPDC050404 TaxID=3155783 RepID=UPI0033E67A15
MEPARRSHDPLAVALANASLLNVGYLMLGRWRAAVRAGGVTLALILILALSVRSVWLEIVVLLWWLALIAHGWYLAGGREGRTDRGQRLVALGITIPVLVAVGFLRFDAARIEGSAAQAHREGDCSRATSIMNELRPRHLLADAPLTVRVETAAEACAVLLRAGRQSDRLEAAETLRVYAARPGALWKGATGRRADLILAQAADELDTALTGDTEAMKTGFGHLSAVLKGFPGQEGKVTQVLNGFLGGLPLQNPCATREITDWLRQRPAGGDVLDRAGDVVPRLAPAAIVGCGGQFMAAKEWRQAREQYRELLAQYPRHELAGKAEQGVRQAGQEIELANVRGLLKTPAGGGQPAYCSKPAVYSGADPYKGRGPHRAMLFGQKDHKKQLPGSWLAKDPADATLVICAGESKFGSRVASCPYRAERAPHRVSSVSFRKEKVPVRAYELRTGKRVGATSIQISGKTCPRRLPYFIFGDVDTGPPSKVYVDSAKKDVRAAYSGLIKP